MGRVAIAILSLILSLSSLAFGDSLTRLSRDGRTIGDLIRQLHHAREGSTIRPNVVRLDAPDYTFLFPAAGSVPGAGGTYFRSDVTLVNYRSIEQRIAVGWFAQGRDNSTSPLQYFVLPANTPVALGDFVAATLHESGLGAVLVVGQTTSGGIDTLADLDGFSRIWTPQPGAAGTVSLAFPSIAFDDSLGSLTAYALGLRHDEQYRSNVGIVNTDSVSHTWTVRINGLRGSEIFAVSVPPISMRQVAFPPGTYGDLVISLESDGFGFWWSAYGASVDNLTGDGWVSHASQP